MSEKTKAELNGSQLVHSFNPTEVSEGNFNGLTKRELFALELTKATVIGIHSNCEPNTWHGWSEEAFANEGIRLADALLNQLSNEH